MSSYGHNGYGRRPAALVVAGDDPRLVDPVARLLAGLDPAIARLDGRAILVAALGRDAIVVLADDADGAARAASVKAVATAQPDVRIVATMPGDASRRVLRRALQSGAAGIVLDGELDRTLVPTIRAVRAGQLAVPAMMCEEVAPRPLSHREKQVLALVVKGRTNRQIADDLFLAESTIKTHLSSAFAKLDTRSRAEAAALILDTESGGAEILAGVDAPAPYY